MSGDEFHLQPATIGDVDRIARIKLESWHVAYRGIVPDAVINAMTVQDIRANWLGVAESELTNAGLVLFRGAKAIGYALFGVAREPSHGYSSQLYALYLLPSEFGAGASTRLFDAVSACLRRDGHADMILWVFEANARARRFYEKMDGQLLAGAEQGTSIGGRCLREVAYGFRLADRLK